CALAEQKFSIFLGINIIGDYSQIIAGPELFTQPINQSCFTTTDRASNPNSECRQNLVIGHDKTILLEQEISLSQRQNLGWFAGQQFTVGTHLICLGINLDSRHCCVMDHISLPDRTALLNSDRS